MRIKKIRAADLHAGSYLVIKDGNITKYMHVNEVYKNSKIVKFAYQDKSGAVIRDRAKPRQIVRIRVRR